MEEITVPNAVVQYNTCANCGCEATIEETEDGIEADCTRCEWDTVFDHDEVDN